MQHWDDRDPNYEQATFGEFIREERAGKLRRQRLSQSLDSEQLR